jgi:hypothetical protein
MRDGKCSAFLLIVFPADCWYLAGACAGNEHERLNDPKVLDVVKSFIPRLAHYEGLEQSDAAAGEAIWQAACSLWEAAGGCPMTAQALQSIQRTACA